MFCMMNQMIVQHWDSFLEIPKKLRKRASNIVAATNLDRQEMKKTVNHLLSFSFTK